MENVLKLEYPQGSMTIVPKLFFPATQAHLKKLDKVVQIDYHNGSGFWERCLKAIEADTIPWIDGQIEAYQRLADKQKTAKQKKRLQAVVKMYQTQKKKVQSNVEFIEHNFIEGGR